MFVPRVTILLVLLALGAVYLSARGQDDAPEIGSPEWCDDLLAKPMGAFSPEERAGFVAHCTGRLIEQMERTPPPAETAPERPA